MRTQECVQLIHGKRAIGVRAIEVLLYKKKDGILGGGVGGGYFLAVTDSKVPEQPVYSCSLCFLPVSTSYCQYHIQLNKRFVCLGFSKILGKPVVKYISTHRIYIYLRIRLQKKLREGLNNAHVLFLSCFFVVVFFFLIF